MSDEITAVARLTSSKASREVAAGSVFSADQTGTNDLNGTLALTTSWEAIPKGDVGTIGFVHLKNTGATNIGIRNSNTGDAQLLVKPGEQQLVRLGTDFQTPYARAESSTGTLQFLIVED